MFGFEGLEFGLRLLRVTCALIVSLLMGAAGSIFLAAVANTLGLYADRVFNVSGPALVVLIFYYTYLHKDNRKPAR